MKIWEIIDPTHNKYDTADILKNDHIVKLDKYFDTLKNLTNDFKIPKSWLYSPELDEITGWIIDNQESIINSFSDENNRWNIKIHKLKKYFDIQ